MMRLYLVPGCLPMAANYFNQLMFRSCEEISGTLSCAYREEISASPVRSKAAALCNEAAKPKVLLRRQ